MNHNPMILGLILALVVIAHVCIATSTCFIMTEWLLFTRILCLPHRYPPSSYPEETMKKFRQWFWKSIFLALACMASAVALAIISRTTLP